MVEARSVGLMRALHLSAFLAVTTVSRYGFPHSGYVVPNAPFVTVSTSASPIGELHEQKVQEPLSRVKFVGMDPSSNTSCVLFEHNLSSSNSSGMLLLAPHRAIYPARASFPPASGTNAQEPFSLKSLSQE